MLFLLDFVDTIRLHCCPTGSSTLSMSSSDIESKEEECGTKGTNDPSPCKKVESSARLSVAALLDAAELAFTNETGLRRLANLSGPRQNSTGPCPRSSCTSSTIQSWAV